jgi:hypothetical protein
VFIVYAQYAIAPCCIETAGVTAWIDTNDCADYRASPAFAAYAASRGYTEVEDYRGHGGNISSHRPADGRFLAAVGDCNEIEKAEFSAACLVNASYSF